MSAAPKTATITFADLPDGQVKIVTTFDPDGADDNSPAHATAMQALTLLTAEARDDVVPGSFKVGRR